MKRRNAKHSADECAIFSAFLKAHPCFASSVRDWSPPEGEFPDVIAILKDDSKIHFELGEWLNDQQIAQGKRREKLVEAMEKAIGQQGENTSNYIRFVMLDPCSNFPSFQIADRKRFHDEVWSLIAEIESRWPNERFWHSPQGHYMTDFTHYPTVGKYVSSASFLPLDTGDGRKSWPAGQRWISCSMHGTWYSPDTALQTLIGRVQSKIEHYGGLSVPVRLIIYYAKAVFYNTPWHSPGTKTFFDVAETAAKAIARQNRFEKIYLLKALEPDLEAYEIFPRLSKCD